MTSRSKTKAERAALAFTKDLKETKGGKELLKGKEHKAIQDLLPRR